MGTLPQSDSSKPEAAEHYKMISPILESSERNYDNDCPPRVYNPRDGLRWSHVQNRVVNGEAL